MKRLLLALTALVLASCQIPLSTPSTPGMGTFTLKTSMSGIKGLPSSSLGAGRTILPTVPVYHYTLDLAGATPYSFSNLTDPNQSFSVPLGNYTLTVTMYNQANEIIGASAGQAITVSAAAASNQYPVTVLPQIGGQGLLTASYSWPTALVTNAEIELVNIADTENSLSVPSLVVDLEAGTASLSEVLPSGTYFIKLQLSYNGVAGSVVNPSISGVSASGMPFAQPRAAVVVPVVHNHPAVSEIARVYNNLESAKTYTLAAADLNEPPADVTAFQATYDANNDNFLLTWSADASTRDGFNIYHNGTLVETPDRFQTSTVLYTPISFPNEQFTIKAVNPFGESAGLQSIATVATVVPQPMNLKVGRSTTTGSKNTTLELTWNSGSPVTIYRSTELAGPYKVAHTASAADSSFTDNNGNGLLTGTTYYYTIAPTGGHLFGLTSTLYWEGNPDQQVSHVDPVADVVAGTTLVWNSDLGLGVPKIGVPYRVPNTSQIPAPTVTVDAPPVAPPVWSPTERPIQAILAGGYSYTIWGGNSHNAFEFLIAAFDSQGVYQNSLDQTTNRYISGWVVDGTDIKITGAGGGTSTIPWSALDWFTPSSVQASIDFTIPTAPTITFNGVVDGQIVLDKAMNPTPATLSVDPQLGTLPDGPWTLVDWTLDGYLDADSTALTVTGDVAAINSQYLTIGSHEAMVTVSDGTHFYSASFTVMVAFSANPAN